MAKKKRTSSKTSKRNLKKLKEMGASKKTIKSFGKRVSDKEMERYYAKEDPLVQKVLKSTSSFRPPTPSFEETYTPALQAEDLAQSKALFEPYFQQQISDVMEDLNAWSTNENIDYRRTLRRARATYASRGTGIGTKREGAEKEMTGDYERRKQQMTKQTERNVGSEAIQGAGMTPFYNGRQGEIMSKMTDAIEEDRQKNEATRRARYEDMTTKYYKQEGNTNWLGKPI